MCDKLTSSTRSGPAPINESGLLTTIASLYTPGWTTIRSPSSESSIASEIVK